MVEGGYLAVGAKAVFEDVGTQANITLKSDGSVPEAIASCRGRGKVSHIEVCQLWMQKSRNGYQSCEDDLGGERDRRPTRYPNVGREALFRHMGHTGKHLVQGRRELALAVMNKLQMPSCK